MDSNLANRCWTKVILPKSLIDGLDGTLRLRVFIARFSLSGVELYGCGAAKGADLSVVPLTEYGRADDAPILVKASVVEVVEASVYAEDNGWQESSEDVKVCLE